MTRRNLLRVNKIWYALAAPILYEYILLSKDEMSKNLVDTMARSASDTSRSTIGSWTRRLDVNIRINPEIESEKTVMGSLAQLLSYLPNLQVLTFSITGPRARTKLPSDVFQSLTCHRTLRILHWYTYFFLPVTDWSVFLKKTSQIESINTFHEFPYSEITDNALDSLKVVHFNERSFINDVVNPSSQARIWTHPLPSLQYATVELDFLKRQKAMLPSFFSAVGRQLVRIQLHQLFYGDVDLAANFKLAFEEIYKHCCALEQINFVFLNWDMLDVYTPTLPAKVNKLVIQIIKAQLSKSDAHRLFSVIFVRIKKANPHLKAIQFQSQGVIRSLCVHRRVLSKELQYVNNIGLSIFDDKGNIMQP